MSRRPSGGGPVEAAGRTLSDRIMEMAKMYQLRSRNRVCRHGITVSQCYALEVITKSGGLLVTELAAALSLDKSTASRVADSLTRLELAVVEAVPGNDRKKRIVPTRQGASLEAKIANEIRREHQRALRQFSEHELAVSARILGALLEAPPAGARRR